MTTESDEEHVPDARLALKAGIEGAEEKPETEDTKMSSTEEEKEIEAPAWSFGVIRVLRMAVGVVVLFAVLFDFHGATNRIMTNPQLAVLAFAAITQFIQIEDIKQFKDLFKL